MLEVLAEQYSEAPIAVGITNTGGLVEVLSAGESGTWSIIVTSPRGMSCIVGAGEGWRVLEPPETPPPLPERLNGPQRCPGASA